jgi:hypothetical protein
MSHGSAIIFTWLSTGSSRIATLNGCSWSTWCRSSRIKVVTRSNRNPSTPISVTQYRSESITIRSTPGSDVSTELPHPVTS